MPIVKGVAPKPRFDYFLGKEAGQPVPRRFRRAAWQGRMKPEGHEAGRLRTWETRQSIRGKGEGAGRSRHVGEIGRDYESLSGRGTGKLFA